jgi:hypothetical protein
MRGGALGAQFVQLLQKSFNTAAHLFAFTSEASEFFMRALQVAGLLIEQLLQGCCSFVGFLPLAALRAHQVYHAQDALFQCGKVVGMGALIVLVRVRLSLRFGLHLRGG